MSPKGKPGPAMYKYAKDSDTFLRMDEAIRQNLPTLRKEGVISVRPGYKAVGGWPTRKPAIVVTVASKRESIPAEEMLPAKIGGFAVDVRQPRPSKSSVHRSRNVTPISLPVGVVSMLCPISSSSATRSPGNRSQP